MQSQLVCSGCRTVLLYPRGATNVCCAICNVVTSVPPAGMEMSQLICGGCRTLLMHARGAASVRCSCCHTVNLVPAPAAPATTPPPTHNNIAHVNCGNCHAMLMYPAGAPSVKCAICHFITNVNISDTRLPFHVHRTGGISTSASTSTYPFSWYYVFGPAMGYFLRHCFKHGCFMQNNKHGVSHSHNQTVVVQNPMTVDETGKLVNNVVVGVTT